MSADQCYRSILAAVDRAKFDGVFFFFYRSSSNYSLAPRRAGSETPKTESENISDAINSETETNSEKTKKKKNNKYDGVSVFNRVQYT